MSQSCMRVLHVASGDLWAGAEVQLFTLLRQLHIQCEVHVVLLNHGRLAQELKTLGVTVHVLDEKKQGFISLLMALRRVIKGFQPQLIHSHRQKENILISLATWRLPVPCLQTVHGSCESLPTWRQRIQLRLETLCTRYVHRAIIAVSPVLHTELATRFPQHKVVYIPNGVDRNNVSEGGAAAILKGSAQAVHIGIAGRLVAVKRVDLFIDIAARLKRVAPHIEWQFHVFGDGPLRDDLEAQAHQQKLDTHLHFYGHLNNVSHYLASLNILLITSDHEGLPMVSLEAMALNVPVLAHSVGALSELIDDSRLLVTRQNVDEFARKTVAAVESKLACPSLKPHYDAAHNAQQVLLLYQGVLT